METRVGMISRAAAVVVVVVAAVVKVSRARKVQKVPKPWMLGRLTVLLRVTIWIRMMETRQKVMLPRVQVRQ